MHFFEKLFTKRRQEKKPSAIAFVDFEHWYISLKSNHCMRPNIQAWYAEITKKYDVNELAFFGDFSTSIGQSLNEIRDVTTTVIDTQNPGSHYRKDYTDFLILDYIYRKAISAPDIDTFILFTGDGHFSSVVGFLRNERKKNVVVYGIRQSFSNQLRKIATECIEIPRDNTGLQEHCMKCIVEDLAYVSQQPIGKVFPTFKSTIDKVSRDNGLPPEIVQSVLQKMINKEYIIPKMDRVDSNRKIKVLSANWELLIRDGLWKP